MTETAWLAEFLWARVEEEELLARAFGDADASALCAGKRWVITAGSDAGLRLLARAFGDADAVLECAAKRRVIRAGPNISCRALGLMYVDHPDYRYTWMT